MDAELGGQSWEAVSDVEHVGNNAQLLAPNEREHTWIDNQHNPLLGKRSFLGQTQHHKMCLALCLGQENSRTHCH